ncbi:MAG: hypothetical protein JO006_07505 [Paucibacter sp.]|nr:hypothetical protein [Roseateles sp.]
MNISAHPASQPASRLTGLGLAVGVHVLLILGFASAFVIQQQSKPAPPPEVKIVEDQPRPPQPQPPVRADRVRLNDPTFTEVLTPPVFEISPPPVNPVRAAADDGRVRDPGPVAPQRTLPVTQAQTLQAPGTVCTKMSSPVMPNVAGSGEALFRVTASTHAGRVTSIEIQTLRAGMEARAMRAFRSAIETALREGYECPGDVGFVQDFQFRLD